MRNCSKGRRALKVIHRHRASSGQQKRAAEAARPNSTSSRSEFPDDCDARHIDITFERYTDNLAPDVLIALPLEPHAKVARKVGADTTPSAAPDRKTSAMSMMVINGMLRNTDGHRAEKTRG